jgi:hypothetical protein
MKTQFGSLLLFCALVLPACGSGPGKAPPPAAPAPAETPAPAEKPFQAAQDSGNFRGGNCGSKVVWEYNTVVKSCLAMRSPTDAGNCKTLAKSFLEKYPGISCQAQKFNPDDERLVNVQALELQKVVDSLAKAGF